MNRVDASPTAEELEGIDLKTFQRRWAILATMCLSLVLIVATVSSVNVAIPALAKSNLRPTATQILWIVDAYALVFAALLLPAGALGDRFGRKGALLIGLVIFAAASATCAFMKSSSALIACRAVMGIGAALIMPSTLSLLQSCFPRRERAKAIAMWAGFAGAGGAIGPVLGGLLVENFWYGSVFFVAAPIATVAFIASAILAPSSREAVAHPLDFGGAALSIAGFAALLAAIIEGPERGWGDGLVVAGFAVAIVCLVRFVFYERRAAEPMLDMRFFRNHRFAMGSMGITVTFFAMFSLFFLLTQYTVHTGVLAAGGRCSRPALRRHDDRRVAARAAHLRPFRSETGGRRWDGDAHDRAAADVAHRDRHVVLVRGGVPGGRGVRRRLGDAVTEQRHRAKRAHAQGRCRLGRQRHHS